MVDSHAYSERKVTLKSQKGNLGTEKVKLVMLMLSLMQFVKICSININQYMKKLASHFSGVFHIN